MSEIDHELKIDAAPERVFEALTTLEGVRGWHAPTASGSGAVGSEWVFPYADHPEFHWEITESESPTRVAWICVACSALRAYSVTLRPARAATSANAVPQAPAPITLTDLCAGIKTPSSVALPRPALAGRGLG